MDIEPKSILRFTVLGDAHPKGSHNACPIPNTNGPYIHIATNRRVQVIVAESNKKVVPFMKQIAAEAIAGFKGLKGKGSAKYSQYSAVELNDRPMILRTIVERVRSKNDYRSDGTLKDSARLYPDTKPVMGKVVRAVEDALEGVIFTNDSRIIRHSTEKIFGEVDRVTVELLVLPKSIAEAKVWDTIEAVPQSLW